MGPRPLSDEEVKAMDYIIVGLGNPGLKYRNTRHNMGFLAIDALAKDTGARFNKKRFRGITAECRIEGRQVLLLKPHTFMNLSGEAVAEVVQFYKLPPERLIVLYDDIDLAAGSLRIKARGSAGTHNGMRSIIGAIKTERFPRVRIGIGKPEKAELVSYVLGKPEKSQRADIGQAIENAAAAAALIVSKGVEAAQQKYN